MKGVAISRRMLLQYVGGVLSGYTVGQSLFEHHRQEVGQSSFEHHCQEVGQSLFEHHCQEGPHDQFENHAGTVVTLIGIL